jgi:hypothetical protein
MAQLKPAVCTTPPRLERVRLSTKIKKGITQIITKKMASKKTT